MTIGGVWITVGDLLWVEMRTSRDATVGVVSKLVNVETTLGVWIVAGDVPGDDGVGVLGGLLESDGALDVGVTTKNCDCRDERKWMTSLAFFFLSRELERR